MKLSEIITSLSILREQLLQRGIAADVEYEKLEITLAAIRLTRAGKVMRIPLRVQG